jgi:hypothetical protein
MACTIVRLFYVFIYLISGIVIILILLSLLYRLDKEVQPLSRVIQLASSAAGIKPLYSLASPRTLESGWQKLVFSCDPSELSDKRAH